MGLRIKIILPLLLSGLLLASYLYGFWLPRLLADAEDAYKGAIKNHLDSVAEGLVPLLLGRQLDAIYGNLDALLKKNESWVSLELFDPQGRLLYPLDALTVPKVHKADDVRTFKHDVRYLDTNLGNLVVKACFTEKLDVIRREYGRLLYLFIIAMILFFLTTGFILERLVRRPIKLLADASQRLAEGNFDIHVEVNSEDEIGRLTRAFNKMALGLKESKEDIQQNYDIVRVTNSLLALSLEEVPLESIMDRGLEYILSIPWLVLQGRGSVFLVDDDSGELVMKASSGLDERIQKKCSRVAIGKCLCGLAAKTSKLQFADCIDERHEVNYEGIIPHGHYCVPMLFSGKTLGVVNLYLHEGHIRIQKEEEFMTAIANALAGVIARKQAEKKIQQYQAHLEDLVRERTEDLTHANRALRAIAKCREAIVHAESEQALINEVCRVMVEVGGYRFAWVGYPEHDENKTVRPMAHAGHEDGYLQAITVRWDDSEFGRGPAGTAIREGKPVVVRNIATDPAFSLWREEAFKHGYAAVIGLPLKTDSEILGVLAVYAGTGNVFAAAAADEIKLLTELAGDIAFGMRTFRTEAWRKQAEEALKVSEEKFRTIFDNAGDGILLADMETNKFYTGNEMICRMLGYSIEEIRNLGVSDIHPEESLPYVIEQLEKLTRGEITLAKDTPVKRKDGTVFYAEISSSPITIAGRQCVAGFFRDITERKRAAELQEARTRLLLFANSHSSDELLEETLNEVEKLTDSLIGFYHLVDPDQNSLTLQNWSTRTKKEFCKAEGKGAHYEIARAGVWVDCLRQRKPVIHNDYASLPHKKGLPPGHAMVVRELVAPVMRGDRIMALLGVGNKPGNYDEQDIKIVSLLADLVWGIIENKLAAEEIKKLNEELKGKVKELIETQEELVRKEKLAILGQLAGSVGHELRSPLGVMSNAVYFLRMVLPDADETVKEYLGIIKKEIDNSEQIIADLLGFARTKTPQTQATTVNELITKSLEKCTVPENVTIELDIPETLPGVKVDPLQMGQVFQNLITNGIQAMPNGGSVRVSARRVQSTEFKVQSDKNKNCELGTLNSELAQNFIEISVADTGEGITPENMKKLFQPLFTTKARGVGLGLTVVKNLIEANGGRIEVESQVEKGTTCTVIMPVGGDTI